MCVCVRRKIVTVDVFFSLAFLERPLLFHNALNCTLYSVRPSRATEYECV